MNADIDSSAIPSQNEAEKLKISDRIHTDDTAFLLVHFEFHCSFEILRARLQNWLDEKKRVFIYYTVDEIIEKMGCCKQKALKLLNKLKEFGLIECERKETSGTTDAGTYGC